MSKSIMNPSEKKAWTALLRSGTLAQGRQSLRHVNEENVYSNTGELVGTVEKATYCCLGVARLAISGRQPVCDAQFLRPGTFGLTEKIQDALAIANDPADIADVREAFRDAGFKTIPKRDKRRINGGYSSFKAIADWIDANL